MFDLGFFSKIFQSNGGSSFYQLYTKMIKWKESKVFPFPYNLPNSISFPSEFWKDVISIYKETDVDGLERAISVFWADGELIVTSIVKGNESSVTSNHNLSIKYSPTTKREYLKKEVILNGKTIKKKDVYYKKAPKKISVEYLFNMHTHPAHILPEDGVKRYSFFSLQDINSLLNSNAIITGLVTDKLWLLVRTSETPSNCILEEKDISVDRLKEDMKIAVYEANFNGKAFRL